MIFDNKTKKHELHTLLSIMYIFQMKKTISISNTHSHFKMKLLKKIQIELTSKLKYDFV